MTTEIFGGSISLDRQERAKRAVAVFRSMQPGLTGYARAMTRNQKITVEITDQGGSTDGKKIYFKPPIALGDRTPHNRSLCDRRDRSTLHLLCPACRLREEVLIVIYHEIAHNSFGTFAEPTDQSKKEAVEHAIAEVGTKFAERMRKEWDSVPDFKKGDYINLASLISPFLPTLVNAIEDARVDARMFEARKGTKVMFDALTRGIFAEGVEEADGTKTAWRDKPLNSQAIIGVFTVACGYNYEGWFHPEVEAALKDEKLTELCLRAERLDAARDSYNLSFKILARLRELGFCLNPNEPQDEEPEPEQQEEQEDGDSSDEGSEEEDSEGDSDSEEGSSGESESAGEDSESGDPSESEGGEDAASSGEGHEDSGGDQPESGEPSEGEDGDADADAQGSDRSGDPTSGGGSGEGDASADGSGDSSDRAGEEEDSGRNDSSDSAGEGDSGGDDEEDSGRNNADESSEDSGEDVSEPAGDDVGGDAGEEGEDGDGVEGSDPSSESSSDPSEGLTDGEEGSGDGEDQGDGTAGHDGEPGHGDELATGDQDLSRTDDPASYDWDSSEPDSRDGDDPELEAVDSGADEGEGGDRNDKPDFGTAEQAIQDLKVFTKHDIHGSPEKASIAEQTEDEEKAVTQAIIQGQYFETGSANVKGVREIKYGGPYPDDSRGAWEEPWSEVYAKQSGQVCDMDIPESVLSPALLEMRAVFADNARAKNEHHLRSGKINKRVLGKRAWSGDPRLFQKKRLPGKKSYAVLLGIDISASTTGRNIVLAKRAAMAQAQLLSRAGIDFAMYAHSANGGYGWGNELWLDVYEIKAFSAPWGPLEQKALTDLGPDSENLDGHTIEYYRKMIEHHPATDKIILYYSDGKMPAANHDEELEVLQREIAYCKKHSITLMGVGIRTDSPRRHGLDTVQVNDDSDLVKVIRHLKNGLLRSR